MKLIKINIILLFLIPLVGCWDAIEIEEQAYVVAIGIDKGKGNNIDVTFQIGNPQVGSSDIANADREPASEIITMTTSDKIAARDLANISTSRRISFTHAKTFIVSEEVAKGEELFSLLEALTRDPQVQRQMDIIISKERAEEFIRNNDPKLETRPHKNYELMAQRWDTTGLVPASDINRFLQRIEGDSSGFLAIYATIGMDNPNPNGQEDKYEAGEVNIRGGNPSQMIGSAVLKEGKMVGSINGEETRLVLLLRPHSKANNWYAVYPDPLKEDTHVTVRLLKKGKPEIKVDVTGPEPKIDVKISLDIHLLLVRSFIDYVGDQKNQEILIKTIEKYLEDAADRLVEKSQKEFEVDIFQWSLAARKKFLTIPQYTKYDWMKSFPESKVNIDFDIKLKQFGKQLQPIDLERIKD